MTFAGVLLGRLPLLPPRHGDPSLLRGPLWTNWQITPSVLLGVLALATGYLLAVGQLNRPASADEAPRLVRRSQRLSFLAGCVALLLALGPPLEDWAGLLVSAHMVQHMILLFVVPLIAAGQNLKRLLAATGWGRRPFPNGSAGVVLPTLPLLRILTP